MSKWVRLGAVAAGVLFVIGLIASLTLGQKALGNVAGSGKSDTQLDSNGPPAPAFTGIVDWENTRPLTVAGLRGKVVLVDFWTYSCINCQRTLPFLRQWWDKYQAEGLVIVGVHSPEFEFEKNVSNVRRAIHDLGVVWPVALDSNMDTWNAYRNQFWPAEYLIDQQGRIRHTHFGEGEYDVTERAIQQLMRSAGHQVSTSLASADPGIGPDARAETGETYAGSARGDGSIRLVGAWSVEPDFAAHTAAAAPGQDYAEIQFRARRVYLVAGESNRAVGLRITIDGRDLKPGEAGSAVYFDSAGHASVIVDRHDLYPLISLETFATHVLRISPDAAGFQLFTFTFGS